MYGMQLLPNFLLALADTHKVHLTLVASLHLTLQSLHLICEMPYLHRSKDLRVYVLPRVFDLSQLEDSPIFEPYIIESRGNKMFANNTECESLAFHNKGETIRVFKSKKHLRKEIDRMKIKKTLESLLGEFMRQDIERALM